jgi:hypothetical protein
MKPTIHAVLLLMFSIAARAQTAPPAPAPPVDPFETGWNVAVNGSFSNVNSAAHEQRPAAPNLFRLRYFEPIGGFQVLNQSFLRSRDKQRTSEPCPAPVLVLCFIARFSIQS